MKRGEEGLTPFGRLVKQLREERRMSPEDLAEKAGIPGTTLWRRLTGRGAITVDEVRRIAEALGVPNAVLVREAITAEGGQWEPGPDVESLDPSPAGEAITDYVGNLDRILRTLRSFPGGDLGKRLKIGYLNLVEDIARDTGNVMPLEYYGLRKQVNDGEL